MEQKENKRKISTKHLTAIVIALVVLCVVTFYTIQLTKPSNPEIITSSTLENIIKISKLSTYTAVYNGIAQVMNEENPEDIDFYVSYKAKVKSGLDFEKINITVDNEAKQIQISIPEIYITETTVDITSLDFLFYNDKANTSTVSERAYKECEKDVITESQAQGAILDLAKQNAVNTITALFKPLVEQLDAEYTLIVS